LSKEHVWPDWLSRFLLFDEELDWVHADDSGIRAIKRAPAFSRKVRKVCTSCNTGWMSQLEEDAKPLLKWMIAGHPVSLDFESRQLLAFWGAKTVLMGRFMDRDPTDVPPSYFAALHESRATRCPPVGTRAWLAFYGGRRHPLYWGFRGHDIELTSPKGAVTEVRAFTGTISVGRFVTQVFGHDESPVPIRVGRSGWRHDGTVQIYHRPRGSRWPPRRELDDERLREFGHDPRIHVAPSDPLSEPR
jgi:hypothetical protein